MRPGARNKPFPFRISMEDSRHRRPLGPRRGTNPMIMKSALMAAALAAGLSSCFTDTSIAAGLGEIKARGELIVGVKDADPPFGYRDESGELIGLEIDLARELAERLGVKLTPFPVSASGRLQFLQQGTIDLLIATMAVTPNRLQAAGLVEPYYYADAPVLLTRRRAGIKSLASLAGKPVCTISNAYYNKRLAAPTPKIELLPFRRLGDAVRALADGDCVALAEEQTRLLGLMRQSGDRLAKYTIVPLDLEPLPWAIAVRPGELNSDLGAFLADTVNAWHRSGRLIELEKKWLGANTPWVLEMHRKLR
jgi:polar amino acid transport system substrate-binding protein